MAEFDIIQRLLTLNPVQREDVVLGIGDDAAVVSVPDDCELVITTDTLNSGVHFPTNTPPQAIGHKSLAVNLSDLAAMGATPAWISLSLCLPTLDMEWINQFALGLFSLAKQHDVQLIGGDTTQGPLSISIQAQGFVPKGQALRRNSAQVGDYICVTGSLGDAGLDLFCLENNLPVEDAHKRLNYPTPQIATGIGLRGIANAVIDVSDGIISDLGHILTASHVGAKLQLEHLPRSKRLQEFSDQAKTYELALSAGDDYELCFTVPDEKIDLVNALQEKTRVPVTHIGNITEGSGLLIHRKNGAPLEIACSGYEHFSA